MAKISPKTKTRKKKITAKKSCFTVCFSIIFFIGGDKNFYFFVHSWIRRPFIGGVLLKETICSIINKGMNLLLMEQIPDIRHFVERHFVYCAISSKRLFVEVSFCRMSTSSKQVFVEYFRRNILCLPGRHIV